MLAEFHTPAPKDESDAAIEREFRDFSYIVSHDLAAALRHITEFSRLLTEEFGGDLSGRQEIYAGYVRSAGARCQLMMEQLLVFSRVQQKPLERVDADVTPILDLVRLRLETKARAAGAEISAEPLGETFCDPTMLSLALCHLLDNAIKFRNAQTAPRICIRAAHDEAMWRTLISDNGPGVAPAFREKAFQMFQKLRGDDTLPGVGAGLSISRRIARRHGGEVKFVDADEGACVELTLPRLSVQSDFGQRRTGA